MLAPCLVSNSFPWKDSLARPGRYTPLEIAITIDTLLNELEKECPQRRSVVELKFFLGMTDDEAAEALGLSLHTFQREWYRARQWLFQRLGGDNGKHG